ncbi:hypothetical protein [Amycolatopsis sp. WQ 127309]|uniref:hypothetical protein n=1 Tax=Amycolatopsis sp. WQ 127309 TaxID=2932773 RepID=UPI001FF5554B|nr:hypothetical protein [Amycolatopsis sp. WQ 127309]UOZ03003.1 hypothetical protein MUY22_29570 [Amycolatopsis sp. WQ 127309]
MFTRITRIVSIVAATAFGAIGLVVLPAGALVGWVMLGLVAGAGAWLAVTGSPAVRERLAATGSAASAMTIGVVTGLGALGAGLAIGGLVAVAGGTAAASVLVVAATAWAVWRFRPRPAPSAPPAAAVVVAEAPAAAEGTGVTDLSTAELCLAWRRSYGELLRATDEPARRRVVRSRRAYLDEIERRDREGFARWLGSGARAGGDPQRYLAAGG